MIRRSKNVLIVASLYSLIFAGLLINGVYLISDQGRKLEITKTQISEHTAKEAAYSKMMSLLESSKENRTTLKKFFITENDTISFLATIEAAAKKNQVDLKTNELAVLPREPQNGVENLQALAISFSFSGTESAVKKFLVLLEHIPYHTAIPKVTLSGTPTDDVWTGSVQLRLTLLP